MDDAHDGSYPREPQLDDLVRLARALNAHDVRYGTDWRVRRDRARRRAHHQDIGGGGLSMFRVDEKAPFGVTSSC